LTELILFIYCLYFCSHWLSIIHNKKTEKVSSPTIRVKSLILTVTLTSVIDNG